MRYPFRWLLNHRGRTRVPAARAISGPAAHHGLPGADTPSSVRPAPSAVRAASASHSRALAVARRGQPAGRQRRAGFPDVEVCPGEFFQVPGQLMRVAAAGGAGDAFGEPGDDAEQRQLVPAGEGPRPEPGRLAVAQAQAGRPAQGRGRIRMRETDRVERVSENVLNGLSRIDHHRLAGRDPGQRVADGIGAGERYRQSRRARTRQPGCGGPDHPFPILVVNNLCPGSLGQPDAHRRGEPLLRLRPGRRRGQVRLRRRADPLAAERVAARAGRAGLADPDGQGRERVGGDGDGQVAVPGDGRVAPSRTAALPSRPLPSCDCRPAGTAAKMSSSPVPRRAAAARCLPGWPCLQPAAARPRPPPP